VDLNSTGPAALTVLTVRSAAARILMIRLPARPSRWNAMSMPTARSEVCARRSRPASARGLRGQSGPPDRDLITLERVSHAQEVRGGSVPLVAACHNFPHAGRNGIGLDDAFHRRPAIGRVGACDGTGGPQRVSWAAAHNARSAMRGKGIENIDDFGFVLPN